MPSIRLVPIPESGEPPIAVGETIRGVLDQIAKSDLEIDYQPPWVGYLGVAEIDGAETVVGLVGFKGPPAPAEDDGRPRVEIGYMTEPGHEGRGYATAMAAELVRLANDADPTVVVAAQTLREEGPSTAILRKLGFTLHAELLHPEDGEVWEWRQARP